MTAKFKIDPQDFFLNLLVFGALYASVVSFLILIFAYINVLLPDQLGYYGNYAGEIITPSSILLVIFPVFIFISRLLGKDFRLNPEKRKMGFRKWLIYITLFIAAVTIIIDLITLISGFYNGELAARFVYKALAVLFIAAGVFSYYFLDLKTLGGLKPKWPAGVASVLVLTAVVGGFFIVGSPAQQRARRFDERRINDLQNIQGQLLNYWTQKEKLPESLRELAKDQLSGFILPIDPETGLDYKYSKLTAFSFKFCGNFKTDSKDYPENKYKPMPERVYPADPFFKGYTFYNWAYQKGETCFERTIDPELYKKKI